MGSIEAASRKILSRRKTVTPRRHVMLLKAQCYHRQGAVKPGPIVYADAARGMTAFRVSKITALIVVIEIAGHDDIA